MPAATYHKKENKNVLITFISSPTRSISIILTNQINQVVKSDLNSNVGHLGLAEHSTIRTLSLAVLAGVGFWAE